MEVAFGLHLEIEPGAALDLVGGDAPQGQRGVRPERRRGEGGQGLGEAQAQGLLEKAGKHGEIQGRLDVPFKTGCHETVNG